MFDRFLLGFLERWNTKLRRKPLILRGARQTGKSTLIRLFAKKNNLKLNEINLERNLFLDEIFKSLDMDRIINELEAVTGSNIQENSSILFLDEIQATPHALQALRYFYEDRPEIRVISAGSLLEFVLSDHSFSMSYNLTCCNILKNLIFQKPYLYQPRSGLKKNLNSIV